MTQDATCVTQRILSLSLSLGEQNLAPMSASLATSELQGSEPLSLVLRPIKALSFDILGTSVDWLGTVSGALAEHAPPGEAIQDFDPREVCSHICADFRITY